MLKLANMALVVALVCLGSLTARADDAKAKIDVTGHWNAEVDIGGQSGSPSFTFKQKGEELTGKYKGQFGEADIKGTVKGDKIEFSFSIGDGKAEYSGTIDKDTMRGKCKYGDQASGTWTAKKGEKKE